MSFFDRLRGKGPDAATQKEFSLEDILTYLSNEDPAETVGNLLARIIADPANTIEAAGTTPSATNAPVTALEGNSSPEQAEAALSVAPFVGTVHQGAGAPVDGPADEVSPQL